MYSNHFFFLVLKFRLFVSINDIIPWPWWSPLRFPTRCKYFLPSWRWMTLPTLCPWDPETATSRVAVSTQRLWSPHLLSPQEASFLCQYVHNNNHFFKPKLECAIIQFNSLTRVHSRVLHGVDLQEHTDVDLAFYPLHLMLMTVVEHSSYGRGRRQMCCARRQRWRGWV